MEIVTPLIRLTYPTEYTIIDSVDFLFSELFFVNCFSYIKVSSTSIEWFHLKQIKYSFNINVNHINFVFFFFSVLLNNIFYRFVCKKKKRRKNIKYSDLIITYLLIGWYHVLNIIIISLRESYHLTNCDCFQIKMK